MIIQVYAPTSNAEEAEQFYEDLQDLLELTLKKDVLFIIGDWNAKIGSQETPGVTGKFGLGVQNEPGQRLIEFCQENALVIANTLFKQHKRRLYTWTSPDGQHQNQIDSILCSQRWRSSKQSAKTRLGADCGSDHELPIAKLRLKLNKVGNTTRTFRYVGMCVCLQIHIWASQVTLVTKRIARQAILGILQARILEWVAMPSSRGSC